MRLIDADALSAKMYHDAFETDSDMQKWDSGCWIRYKMFEKALEDAPTIEQPMRKRGKWIRITQGAIPEKYMCPFCHRTVEHEGVEYFVSIIYPFCHCGADMRGEAE